MKARVKNISLRERSTRWDLGMRNWLYEEDRKRRFIAGQPQLQAQSIYHKAQKKSA